MSFCAAIPSGNYGLAASPYEIINFFMRTAGSAQGFSNLKLGINTQFVPIQPTYNYTREAATDFAPHGLRPD